MTKRERATYELLLWRLADYAFDGECDPVKDLHEVMRKKRIPMRLILNRVPGESERERARNLGVSPQTWHRWLRGHRPTDREQAARLAKATGFTVKQICE